LCGLQLPDVALGFLRDHVVRLEVVLEVHTELALRQVPDMSIGGTDGVVTAQVLLDRLRLGWRLDDDQGFWHT
jgi:hypothetical protein